MSEEEKNDSLKSDKKTKKTKNKPALLGIGFLVVIVAVFASVYFTGDKQIQNKGAVIFTIDDEKFYENDIKDLIKYPVEKTNESEATAIRTAFETYKHIVTAKGAGINPTESDIQKSMEDLVPENVKSLGDYASKYEKWFRMLATKEAVHKYIDVVSSPGYKGYSFVLYFGQHIEFGDDYKPEGLNDPNLIAQDKEYAKQRAEHYRTQLKDKKMSPDQVDKAIKDDPKLKTFSATKNPFGHSNDSTWEEDVYYESVRNHIISSKKKGLSEIQTGKGYPGPLIKDGDSTVEIYYYFVTMDEFPQSKTLTENEFNDLLAKVKTSYNFDDSKATPDQVKTTPQPGNGTIGEGNNVTN